jgi:magnesium chelatase subunit D
VKTANADLKNPLMRGLACAALNPDLRSVLVFDASIATFKAAAHNLAQMLEVVTDFRVVPIQLGVVETEEDLWGSLALSSENTTSTFKWQRGVLTSGREQELRVVVIPDLTRLSLATARACIALMGSDVAYLERHGHQDVWQPNLCWIAGCSRSEVGLVSPHLLDRFALRLRGREMIPPDRTEVLQQWLRELNGSSGEEKEPLSSEWVEVLKQARSGVKIGAEAIYPQISVEAQKQVLEYITPTENYSVRRELALMRLALTSAQLIGMEQISAEQVDQAAKMIGLEPIRPSLETASSQTREPGQPGPVPDMDSLDQESLRKPQSTEKEPASTPIQEPVYASDTTETLPPQPMAMESATADPYPEDTTPVQRESASLRLPFRRFKNAVPGRGAIVGVEPATVPQDLAIVSTLLEAAKYQQMRRSALLEQKKTPGELVDSGVDIESNGKPLLILQPTDLRRYRRAVVPEQMLALVLDYTCLQDCKWQEALVPYWQWAYEERASVCLVQVGAASARHELQAEKITADRILVPCIRLSLGAKCGRATPLAHGLDLVLQTLRHALQHGRSATQQAVLVVLSDGRGNVPLAASRTGKVTPPVGRQGIEDALQVARQIAGLNDVKSVVLNPQPKHYKELPVKLAQALGAKIAEIPPLKVWEVEE